MYTNQNFSCHETVNSLCCCSIPEHPALSDLGTQQLLGAFPLTSKDLLVSIDLSMCSGSHLYADFPLLCELWFGTRLLTRPVLLQQPFA